MPPDVEIRVRLLDKQVLAACDRFPAEMQAAGEQAVTVAAAELEREVVARTPVAHGFLAGSVFSELEGKSEEGAVRGIVAVNPPADRYALPVETGSKPHWPPIQAILLWLESSKMKAAVQMMTAEIRSRRKTGQRRPGALDDEERARRSLAYLIGRKISRIGTKGAFMFKRAIEENADRLTDFMRERLRAAAERAWGGKG